MTIDNNKSSSIKISLIFGFDVKSHIRRLLYAPARVYALSFSLSLSLSLSLAFNLWSFAYDYSKLTAVAACAIHAF